jgi:hypothetical protein
MFEEEIGEGGKGKSGEGKRGKSKKEKEEGREREKISPKGKGDEGDKVKFLIPLLVYPFHFNHI